MFFTRDGETITLHRAPVVKHMEGKHDQRSHAGARRRMGPDDEYGSKGELKKKPAEDPDKVVTDDHEEAIRALSEGKNVELSSVEKVFTLIERLHKFAKTAKERGEKAPNLDLCKVSVPGTNLFCGGSLGIERAKMPQLKGKAVEGSEADGMEKDKNGEVNVGPEFVRRLAEQGIGTKDMDIPASRLRASQSELVGANVAWMMTDGRDVVGIGKSDPDAAIFVSRDGYVIDGHHRWAASVGLDSSDGDLGDIPISVKVIDMNISEVLRAATEFADAIGIQPKAAKAVKSVCVTCWVV